METYEKKYNEALKWIENIYTELNHERQMEAEAFFPELKESEDESIRKDIIIAVESTATRYFKKTGNMPVWYDKAIAWLEKQAWSEKDKDLMYDTLSNLTELKDRYGEEYGNVGKCIAWIKSLKEKLTETKGGEI